MKDNSSDSVDSFYSAWHTLQDILERIPDWYATLQQPADNTGKVNTQRNAKIGNFIIDIAYSNSEFTNISNKIEKVENPSSTPHARTSKQEYYGWSSDPPKWRKFSSEILRGRSILPTSTQIYPLKREEIVYAIDDKFEEFYHYMDGIKKQDMLKYMNAIDLDRIKQFAKSAFNSWRTVRNYS